MSNDKSLKENTIFIGKPYIKELENNKVWLCSDITDTETKTLYFEVDKKYAPYLCDDRADAFIVGILHSAMFYGKDIICDCGVSEQLLFQLNTYYIPTLGENMPNLNTITIKAEAISEIEDGNAVGTGNSGGVDSFYTMLKYSKENFGNLGLTHVIFNNISSNDDNEERIRDLFEKDIVEKRAVATELGYEFIAMFTNMYQFYPNTYLFNHYFTLQYTAAIHALKKLFGVFYFSSTFPVNMFSMDYTKIVSGARFDIFSLDCVSSKALKFYSSGIETDRLGKMRYIVDKPIVQKHLQVCAIEQSLGWKKRNTKLNCGYCHKCSRTIAIFYAWGILDKYSEIFDLSLFNSNKNKFIGRGIAHDQKTFANDVKKLLKNKNLYTFGMEVWYRLFRIRYTLAKSKKLVKIYHKISSKKLIF